MFKLSCPANEPELFSTEKEAVKFAFGQLCKTDCPSDYCFTRRNDKGIITMQGYSDTEGILHDIFFIIERVDNRIKELQHDIHCISRKINDAKVHGFYKLAESWEARREKCQNKILDIELEAG